MGGKQVSYKSISNKKILKYGIKPNNNNIRITLCIVTLLIVFFVGLILTKIMNEVKIEKSSVNPFYLNVIENTSSVIKCYSKEKPSTTSVTKIG